MFSYQATPGESPKVILNLVCYTWPHYHTCFPFGVPYSVRNPTILPRAPQIRVESGLLPCFYHTQLKVSLLSSLLLCPLCYLHYLCILIQSLLPSELQQQPSLLRCPHTFSDPSSTHFYWKLLKRQICYHLLTDSKIKMRPLPCRSLWAHLLESPSFFSPIQQYPIPCLAKLPTFSQMYHASFTCMLSCCYRCFSS